MFWKKSDDENIELKKTKAMLRIIMRRVLNNNPGAKFAFVTICNAVKANEPDSTSIVDIIESALEEYSDVLVKDPMLMGDIEDILMLMDIDVEGEIEIVDANYVTELISEICDLVY